jgi:hypothetical protein
METFIIRVYRRGENREITGLVELVEINEQRPFAGFEELRKILSIRPGKARYPGKSLCLTERLKDESAI